jgi:ATP-dependent protease ClpP protease subunit
MKMSNFFKITAKGTDAAEIELCGEVCQERPADWWTGEKLEGSFIALDEFKEAIKGLSTAKNVTIKLNSFGGDLLAGKAIYDELKSLKANKTVQIMGVAMSAATIIMLAGDKVIANTGDIIMIHEAKCESWDLFDAEQAQRLANSLNACNKAMAELYAKKTGKGVQEILNAMHAETWLTAQQALDYGLIDEVKDGGADQVKIAASGDRKKLYAAGREMNLHGLTIPESVYKLLPVEAEKQKEATADKIHGSNKLTKQEEAKTMEEIKTTAELEAAYPELVKAIREETSANAKEQERARIREIEEIEASLCLTKDAIINAKFNNPTEARDLAFMNAQQQAKIGAAELEKLKADAEKSGANKVTADGNDGSANTNTAQTQAQAEVKAMLEKFSKEFN